MTERPHDPAFVVYDGECVFCQNYVRMLRLKESVGPVDLIDARSDAPQVRDLWARGYDLDEGMVFSYRGRIYHGSDAIHALALLASPSTVFNRINATVLSHPAIARLAYPWLKAGRRITLWMRGRKLMGTPAVSAESPETDPLPASSDKPS
ncbi:DCC1-like thiol-disulfide oxidoreductase family protein [Novosphingobium beihaiensis]|uniref:DUF393 domain-containing protein n=1 Tax=Novosphingobium beihaiensis TaxID=2930389 RepID=A0ABT0BTJ5_9SPHN|nr:DCC1-like thiol-disulfide oxidoreductase family protein [Novosphingobium beihaiensis]MCJ2188382.1 DUF393 domain-containing protein [Novosphingobium beihaiensis]